MIKACAESKAVVQKVSLAADDSFPAAGPEVDVFFPHTDTHGEDVTCSGLVIDQLSALTHFMWEVGGGKINTVTSYSFVFCWNGEQPAMIRHLSQRP